MSQVAIRAHIHRPQGEPGTAADADVRKGCLEGGRNASLVFRIAPREHQIDRYRFHVEGGDGGDESFQLFVIERCNGQTPRIHACRSLDAERCRNRFGHRWWHQVVEVIAVLAPQRENVCEAGVSEIGGSGGVPLQCRVRGHCAAMYNSVVTGKGFCETKGLQALKNRALGCFRRGQDLVHADARVVEHNEIRESAAGVDADCRCHRLGFPAKAQHASSAESNCIVRSEPPCPSYRKSRAQGSRPT